jgi:DNA-binding NarL/FixJ family response regulator
MRILIADRNARLLESIFRTFAHQFSIRTASTRQRCTELLSQGDFDLAIVSEKLADGPGLDVLGQIARNSPDTLRIFAARRSRLQLLKGRLGPFGLFRTLSYPIDSRKLLSALTLARASREIDVPADPVIGINMPVTITSVRRIRPSELPRTPQPSRVARQPRNATSQLRNVASQLAQPQPPAQQSGPPQPAVARLAPRPRLPSQSEAFQRALARREAGKRAARSQIVSRSSGRGHEAAARPTYKPQLADGAPKRTTVFLGATMVAVFLVSTLTIRFFDAADARSSDVHATSIRSADFPAPHVETEQTDISAPSGNSTPAPSTPSVPRVRNAMVTAVPKPDSTNSGVLAEDPQLAASSTPIADPSTFGTEAAEPIY